MDYNNNTDINKNVMGWIPINNDVSISQAKYPRLVAYIKQNFQVNKVYWDVVGGVRLVNASGLYPRFTGNHWTGFTTNPDAAGRVCGDKIDYANKNWGLKVYGTFVTEVHTCYGRTGYNGIESNAHSRVSDLWTDKGSISLSGGLDGSKSNNETRVKSIFFNLLIYAGYPI